MSTNQPKFSQIDKRTQNKAKVSLIYLLRIFFAFKISQFFQYFFSHTNPYKIGRIRISESCKPGLPTFHTHSLANLQRWKIKVRFFIIPVHVNPLHSGAIVAYSGVTLVSFRFIPVSFRPVPVYSDTILVHSISVRHHSASFRYIPVYSVPFHSVPVFRNAPPSCCITWGTVMTCPLYALWQPLGFV